MSNKSEPAGGLVQSVDRALSILTLLARHGQLGITEIAEQLGVHKSTAFRLVATLEAHDVVTQVHGRGKYRLGVGVLRLAGASRVRLDLVQESRPVTTALAAAVGETVNLAVLSGHEALYLDQVAGPSALQLHMWTGQRIPLHATSNGKVLLAYAPAGTVDALLDDPLPTFTDRTIASVADLQAELRTVREQGFAVAVDELEQGLTAVAAPVVGVDGLVVASLSASGPSFRLPFERLDAVSTIVRDAGADISRRLGWHGVTLDGTGAGENPVPRTTAVVHDTQQ